jgi:hypothetical protein
MTQDKLFEALRSIEDETGYSGCVTTEESPFSQVQFSIDTVKYSAPRFWWNSQDKILWRHLKKRYNEVSELHSKGHLDLENTKEFLYYFVYSGLPQYLYYAVNYKTITERSNYGIIR